MGLALLGLLGSMALPTWQNALTQTQLKARAQLLMADAQWAQWQALRLAEPIDLRPLACAATASTTPAPPGPEWSCGWQVLRPASTQLPTDILLRQRDLSSTLRMQASLAQAAWRFDAQGRWRMGAMRVVWSPALSQGKLTSLTVCVSNTGRWRWQSGSGCST